jgi:hypothetical protein
MTRRERATMRLAARAQARAYLGVERLPAGVPAICQAYADAFTVYPAYGTPGLWHALYFQLNRFRRPTMGLL